MDTRDLTTEPTDDIYTKTYKMRSLGEDKLNTVVSIPRVVIEKEARKRNISVEEFLKTFRAVAHFNGFDGVLYRFEPVPEDEKTNPPNNNDRESQDGDKPESGA